MLNYSIIIPYGDKYDLLVKAIESIPERKDIQIILVDNGKIFLTKEEIPVKEIATLECYRSDSAKGAGHARNVGLQYVKGRKVLFLDADDYFLDNAFSHFDKYLESVADIVYFKPSSINLLTGKVSNRHAQYCRYIDRYLETGQESQLRYWFTVPWCKLFSASLIKNYSIMFDETIASNDLMFSVKAGYFAKRIEVSTETVYVVTEGERNQSIIKNKSALAQYDRFKVAVSQYKFMESVGLYDQRFPLLSYVLHSLIDYGPREFVKYVKYAYRNNVNIFIRNKK